MNYNIRAAQPLEAEYLSDIALASKAYWGYPPEFLAACKDELTITQSKIMAEAFTYMVCVSGVERLGFYGVSHLSECEAELEALFVAPEWIGKGVGKALFNHVVSLAKLKNYTSLKIHSDPNAEDFYLAAGAKLVGREASGSIAGRYLPVLMFTV